VFPSETRKLRARSKTQADVRDLFAFCALTGISSHTFRQTTASLLDESDLTARMIADRLGHAQPTMTMNVYLGQRVADTAAAAVPESPALSSESLHPA
jgi:integrase